MTTAPSTIMPKSIAPIDSRLAGMCAQSRQMNEKSSANGIVTATISAVRTLKSSSPSTTSTRTIPRDQVALDRPRRFLDQIRAIVVRHDLDVGRQHAVVERVGHRLDLLQHQLGLLADAHQDDAFDRVRLAHVAELPEAGSVVDRHRPDVLHVDRDAGVRRDHDVADVVEVP